MLFIWIVAGVVVLWLGWVALASVRDLSVPARQRLGRTTLRTSVAVLLMLGVFLVSLRLGLNWMAAAGPLLLGLLTRLPLFKQWRQDKDGFPKATSGPTPPAQRPSAMSRSEALEVLGVHEGASPEEILHTYKQLMKKVHPDQGGNAYLSAKLNEAKQVLLP